MLSGKRWLLPLALCVFWASWSATTVFNNLNDAGLIAWFSHDEIYVLDLLQYYRTGQYNPDTFQGFYDYGLYYRYVAGLFEVLGRHGIDISPGIALGIIRLLNLISGLLAVVVFWRLLVRHFGTGIPSVIALLGLALSPSFVWHLDFAKPEPVILLVMVLGLDYTLRIVDEPSRRHLILATALAALGAVIKVIGVFLLPGIVLAAWKKRKYFLDGWKLPAILMCALGLVWWFISQVFSTAFLELAGEYSGKYQIARWALDSPEMVVSLWRSPTLLFVAVGISYALACYRVKVSPPKMFLQVFMLLVMIGSLFASWIALLGSGWLQFPKSALFVYGSMLGMHQTSGGAEFQSILGAFGSWLLIILRNVAHLTGMYLYAPGEW